MNGTAPEPNPGAALAARLGDLRSNENLVDATTMPLLTGSECDDVIAQLNDGWGEMAVWATPSDGPSGRAARPEIRRGQQQAVPGGNTGPLASRIVEQILDVNDRIYRFRIVGVEHPVQVLRYSGESADGYVHHMDVGAGASMRKLSFSLLLSDPATFDGGDLAFGEPFALARQQGTLTVFPSFLNHAVMPVTRGVRYAIVGFMIGPAFT
jgi:predicted 2-oxoglutarate/Fe(II)-dependent dioxygenase YbiX